ncbi:MAG: low affinity iron permease family protein [Flavobacteriales bacterium]|nr:low affinity iron permease family protein [Flavobacteriales bacterium]
MSTNTSWFSRVAPNVSHFAGTPKAFAIAIALIVGWLISGPFFHYSDTWQLVINTGTTIITFLMVFLIQNTQNRDSCAVQVKLDELIKQTRKADNALLDLEELEEEDIAEMKADYVKLAAEQREHKEAMENGGAANPLHT